MTAYKLETVLAPAHRQTVRLFAVTDAVRRDQERLVRALGESITAVRRQALSGHVGFLLDQLRSHHLMLDQNLLPLLARHQPELAERVATAGSAHLGLTERATRVREAALAWNGSGRADDRAALRSVIADFAVPLESVVDDDSDLLVAAGEILANADWAAVEGGRIRSGRPTTVARQFFWLLDGLDLQRSDALVDGIPRTWLWVLRNGFSGAYNRSSYLMWHGGGTGPAV